MEHCADERSPRLIAIARHERDRGRTARGFLDLHTPIEEARGPMWRNEPHLCIHVQWHLPCSKAWIIIIREPYPGFNFRFKFPIFKAISATYSRNIAHAISREIIMSARINSRGIVCETSTAMQISRTCTQISIHYDCDRDN